MVKFNTQEVAFKLHSLVGKNVLFPDHYADATVVTQIIAIVAKNCPGDDGGGCVILCTNAGQIIIDERDDFSKFQFLDEDDLVLKRHIWETLGMTGEFVED